MKKLIKLTSLGSLFLFLPSTASQDTKNLNKDAKPFLKIKIPENPHKIIVTQPYYPKKIAQAMSLENTFNSLSISKDSSNQKRIIPSNQCQ